MTGTRFSQDTLRRMVHGYQVSQAIYVAARLDLPDRLAEQPRTAVDLASVVGADCDALTRLLRFLSSVGVFHQSDDDRFSLTDVGAHLRSCAPNSLRDWAIMVAGPARWQAWGDLLTTVRTGETAFPRVHGQGLFEWLAERPEENAEFAAAMSAQTALGVSQIARHVDFSRFRLIADIGGSTGTLLSEILRDHPQLRGLLFDRPEVARAAAEALRNSDVGARIDVVGGDFFEKVPSGADAYLLKQIVHDWDDDRAIAILRTCRAAMSVDARLMIVERSVLPPNEPDPSKYIDMMMLVVTGGRERTPDEYGRLMAAAGFRLDSVTPISSTMSVFEGVPTLA